METTFAKSTQLCIQSDVHQISLKLKASPPFSEKDLLKYIELEKDRLSPVTIKRRLASVAMHASKSGFVSRSSSPEVKSILKSLLKGYVSKRKRSALYGESLKRVLETCPNTLLGKRDRAIILFGFACGGLRRSEIAEARNEDFLLKDGLTFYFLPKSKTDQEGKGRFIPISEKALEAVRDWYTSSGISGGYLFRRIINSKATSEGLSPWSIGEIIKKHCREAGYSSNYYGAHSLRVGFVTASLEKGVSEQDVMMMSGHKSENMVRHYYRSDNPWQFNKALKVMQSLDI